MLIYYFIVLDIWFVITSIIVCVINANITNITNKLFSNRGATKNPQINSIIPANGNRVDRDIRKASFNLMVATAYIKIVLIVITAQLSHMLNGSYIDIANPRSRFAKNRTPPIIRIRFFILI